jgi:hypothetical protein
VTITIAWVRRNKGTAELILASDCRLRSYGALDRALKLSPLERGDHGINVPQMSARAGQRNRRPYWLSSFLITASRSSWFAKVVQLSEMLISTAARRVEILASRPRS